MPSLEKVKKFLEELKEDNIKFKKQKNGKTQYKNNL